MMGQNKPRVNLKVIIGIIVVIVVIGALIASALSAPQNNKKTSKDSSTITFTIEKNIGIDRVIYTNHANPGEGLTLTYIDLPYSGNCSRGDDIEFQTTVREGFQWAEYMFPLTGRSNTDNSLLISAGDEFYTYNNQITIAPTMVYLRVSPTVTPTPIPTPTPLPTPTPTTTPFS
jgi:hypothetical protein